jgi:hypothetical protein
VQNGQFASFIETFTIPNEAKTRAVNLHGRATKTLAGNSFPVPLGASIKNEPPELWTVEPEIY